MSYPLARAPAAPALAFAPAAPREDPQAALIDQMTDDAVLDALGPDWSAMTIKQRQHYAQRPWTLFDQLEAEVEQMRAGIRAAGEEAARFLRSVEQRKAPYQLTRSP